MTELRDEVIGACLADLHAALTAAWRLYDPNDAERAAVRRLVVAALSDGGTPGPPDPLSLTFVDLQGIIAKGHDAKGLAEMFPDWSSWPARTVGDWLKTAGPVTVTRARAYLRDLGR